MRRADKIAQTFTNFYKEILQMTNTEIAKKSHIQETLGGREAFNSVTHCATRLRVMVKDEAKINKRCYRNLEEVQGTFFAQVNQSSLVRVQ